MVFHISEFDPMQSHNCEFQAECQKFAEANEIEIQDMSLDDVETISRKHGPGLGFYLTGTGPRDQLAGKVEDQLNAAGKQMTHPKRSLALDMMHDCTFAYQKNFEGFGKNRPLVRRNWGSQAKRRGEKIGFKIFFDGLDLTVKDLGEILKVLAYDIQQDMKRKPMAEEIKQLRERDLGFITRHNDDYIVDM